MRKIILPVSALAIGLAIFSVSCGGRTPAPQPDEPQAAQQPIALPDPPPATSHAAPKPTDSIPPPGATKAVVAIAFRPDGQRLVSGGADGILRVWDPAVGQPMKSIRTPGGGVWAVAYSPNGGQVLSGETDGRIRIWDAATLRPEGELTGHDGAVRCLAVAPGPALVSGGVDGTIRVWDLAARRQTRLIRAYDDGTVSAVSVAGRRLISTGWGGHGNRVMGTTSSRPARLWDWTTGRMVTEYDFHAAHAALSPDGQTIAGRQQMVTRSARRTRFWSRYCLWDAATGRLLTEFPTRRDSKEAFSPDGRLLTTAGDLGRWQLWEVATGRLIYQAPGGWWQANTFSPDGRWVAAGAFDGRVLLLKVPPEPERWERSAQSADPDRLWTDLIAPNPQTAYPAVWTLVAAPDVAIPLFTKRVRPPTAPDPARVRRLIADLDAPRLDVRDAATKKLRRLGDAAEAPLREALTKSPSPEMTARLESLLTPLKTSFPLRGETLRTIRAVQVLERIGTPGARLLLRQWAKEPHPPSVVEAARRASERLK
jgi:hypothetical protein